MKTSGKRQFTKSLLRFLRPILTYLVGEKNAKRLAEKLVGPSLAWEFHTAESRKRLATDPTHTYTIDSAERDVDGAQLAADAGAWEWCWTDAMNAIAVFGFKGQLDEPKTVQAYRLVQLAEQEISIERLDEMKKLHEISVREHNNLDALHFKRNVADCHSWVWRRIARRIPIPKIDDRPF